MYLYICYEGQHVCMHLLKNAEIKYVRVRLHYTTWIYTYLVQQCLVQVRPKSLVGGEHEIPLHFFLGGGGSNHIYMCATAYLILPHVHV